MTLPTFLVCGIQKGGTTALHAYLQSHPDVFCPERKELNFFDQHWDAGLGWYTEFFQGAPDPRLGGAIGEASPHYMRSPAAMDRIAQTLPDAKLLFILRDPALRAYSNYTYNLGRGQQDPRQSFEAAIATDDGRERYLDKGFYLRDLEACAQRVGRHRMLVLHQEDLRADPAAVLARAFTFIGVDPQRWTPTSLESNATRVPTSPLAQAALYRWGRVRKHLAPLVPKPLKRATHGLRARGLRALPTSSRPPALDPETRRVLDGFYAEANRGLAAWLTAGREGEHQLPAWLTKDARSRAA